MLDKAPYLFICKCSHKNLVNTITHMQFPYSELVKQKLLRITSRNLVITLKANLYRSVYVSWYKMS